MALPHPCYTASSTFPQQHVSLCLQASSQCLAYLDACRRADSAEQQRSAASGAAAALHELADCLQQQCKKNSAVGSGSRGAANTPTCSSSDVRLLFQLRLAVAAEERLSAQLLKAGLDVAISALSRATIISITEKVDPGKVHTYLQYVLSCFVSMLTRLAVQISRIKEV